VGRPQCRRFAALFQPFKPELAHRLQHPVARLGGLWIAYRSQQALLDERLDNIQHGDVRRESKRGGRSWHAALGR
jgi:hypothetical protein